MYSLQTSLIILGMVLVGTARSVGVKVFYQLGCDNPLLIALLYLAGQSFSLAVYGITKYFHQDNEEQEHQYTPVNSKEAEEQEEEDRSESSTDDSSDELSQIESQPVHPEDDNYAEDTA